MSGRKPNMLREIKQLTYSEMHKWLGNPDTRVVDCRILELMEKFEVTLQFLGADGLIYETTAAEGKNIDLFRLQYFNSKRMNPALWGEFDNSEIGNG